MINILRNLILRYRRSRYSPGRTISKFIARDVKREIRIISNDDIKTGRLIVRVRTINLLYLSKGLVKQDEFSPPFTVEISRMWDWSGSSWGGLPDGSSLAERTLNDRK